MRGRGVPGQRGQDCPPGQGGDRTLHSPRGVSVSLCRTAHLRDLVLWSELHPGSGIEAR
jgi:hypothetical protein